MAGTLASDEGSDVEIEEVEVLNPLDLSTEDALQSDNFREVYHSDDIPRDISVEADEHYGDNQDNAIDQEAGSGSDTDHLDVEVDDDESVSVVVENNPSDTNVGASTSSLSINPFRRKIQVHRLLNVTSSEQVKKRLREFANTDSFGNRRPGRPRNDDHDEVETDSASVIEMAVDDTEQSSGQVSHRGSDKTKRSSNNELETIASKKSRQSDEHLISPDADNGNPVDASVEPIDPPENVAIGDNPSYEELLSDNARLRQELSLSTNEKLATSNKYDSLVTKLQAKVECPVCYDVPKQAPVPICPNGHVVCQGCKRDLCPTCRVRMGMGTSILAVTVIENIPHSCEFQIYGCQTTCSIVTLPTHQATCQYRAVKCPNFNCAERVPLTLLAEHSLRRCIHNGTFYSTPLSNSYNYIIPANQTDQFDNRRNSTWRPDGITFDGKNFFLKITRKGKKAMWYFYVQMAGSEEEARQYTATIYVFKTSMGVDGRNSHRFIGDICPIDLVSTDRAAEAGYCCVLTDAQMKRVFTEGPNREADKKFGFSVEVRIEAEEESSAELVVESSDANESVIMEPAAAPSQSVIASEEQEFTRRSRSGRVRTNDPRTGDIPGFRIMRHQRALSPLNLTRRIAVARPLPSPGRTSPQAQAATTVAGPSGSSFAVPVRRKASQPIRPVSSDSSSDEDLVPCPQCGREYEISGVVMHASRCQGGVGLPHGLNREQR